MTEKPNHSKFIKLCGNNELLAEYLERGSIPREKFDEMVGGETPRMNIVSALRYAGYEVIGTEEIPYQVLSWKEPIRKEFKWTPERIEIQKWVDSLRPFCLSHEGIITEALLTRGSTRWHDCSFGTLWAYEAVGNTHPGRAMTWLLEDGDGGLAILHRRHSKVPKYRITDINLKLDQYKVLIPYLSQLSDRPIPIKNLEPGRATKILSLFPKVSQLRQHQSIYLLDQVLGYPEKFLSKKSLKSTRKCLREVRWEIVSMDNLAHSTDARYIIDTWKRYKGATQHRLSIGRDYILLDGVVNGVIVIMGYRNLTPVSLRILSEIPEKSFPESGVADLVEKSFNYSNMPGGHSGMSDACLYAICKILRPLGYTYINGGEAASVGRNLVNYKRKFESEAVYPTTLTIDEVVV